jgi:serine/threonine protein kinase
MKDYFYFKEHLIIMCELLKLNLYDYQKYTIDNDLPNYFTIPRLQVFYLFFLFFIYLFVYLFICLFIYLFFYFFIFLFIFLFIYFFIYLFIFLYTFPFQLIAHQVLEGLAFIHSIGILHCDLKPENILIRSYSRCEVKIIDFGSSCFVTDPLSFYTQSRCVHMCCRDFQNRKPKLPPITNLCEEPWLFLFFFFFFFFGFFFVFYTPLGVYIYIIGMYVYVFVI